MGDFKLSASLEGHEDDVRDVVFPSPNLVASASRDATVRIWKLISPSPPKYDCTISSHGSAFVNAVAYIPPSSEFTEGLLISGGKDTIIEVREPTKKPEDNAERLLMGHAHNICALDVSSDAKWFVSGSWDGTARVWSVGKWECQAVLEGHQGSVWGVLAYDRDIIITACADKLIRCFSPTGKLLNTIKGNTDVVRALCRIPTGHFTDAAFASAGNDGIIRLWQLKGRQVGELRGHESFIYSLACLPNGDIVSSGEDRTVRIWRGTECIQTITHPAISVWGVAVCAENGDFVSAASDRVARIFSRDKIRQGDPKIIQALDDSVKSSSIPQQQVGEVNKEKLPGPEFLTQKSGTKEGQVVMIREADGSVTAHTWSQGAGSWVNVGTVVDAVGSSGKKVGYKGKDYDYVFNVDIEDGKPALKLPYNLSQNPYDAATKFIQDNELPMSYLDEVANFITSNTQGAAVGQNTQSPVSQQPGSDPWGSESRYRPGEISPATSHLPSSSRPKILPQTKYLSIAAANLKTIQKKIEELNIQLSEEGSHDIALSPLQVETLRQLTAHLDPSPTQNPPSPDTLASSLTIIITILTTWPVALHLPALDLLRLLSATTPAAATFRTPSQATIIDTLATSGTFSDTSLPNNAMLATRALANLFETAPGRALVDGAYDAIFKLVSAAYTGAGTANRNLTIAVTTLGINYAVLCTSASHRELPSSMDRGLALLEMLIGILGREKDAEAVYRALVGVGTWLGLGEEMALAAKEVFGLEEALKKVEGGVREPRIKAVVGEIRALVGMVSA